MEAVAPCPPSPQKPARRVVTVLRADAVAVMLQQQLAGGIVIHPAPERSEARFSQAVAH